MPGPSYVFRFTTDLSPFTTDCHHFTTDLLNTTDYPRIYIASNKIRAAPSTTWNSSFLILNILSQTLRLLQC